MAMAKTTLQVHMNDTQGSATIEGKIEHYPHEDGSHDFWTAHLDVDSTSVVLFTDEHHRERLGLVLMELGEALFHAKVTA